MAGFFAAAGIRQGFQILLFFRHQRQCHGGRFFLQNFCPAPAAVELIGENGSARKFHQTDELSFAAAKVGKEVAMMV
jgi:hypothetical protein